MPMIQFSLRLKSFIPICREEYFKGPLAIYFTFTCGFCITSNSFPSAVIDGGKKQKENHFNRNNITASTTTTAIIC